MEKPYLLYKIKKNHVVIGFIPDTDDGDKQVVSTILELMKIRPEVSAKAIFEIIGSTTCTVERHISEMKKDGLISRVEPSNGGHWVVL